MPPRHIALAVLVAVIWGANFVVIELGLGDLPPTLFVALRFIVVLIPAIWFVPRPNLPWRDVAAVGVFMSLGQFSLLYLALSVGMPAGLASLVLQAQVGLTVVIAALTLRERPSAAQVIGVLVGAVGLGVVAIGRAASTPALGLVLVLAAGTSWATGNVIARRASRRPAEASAGGTAGSPSDRPAPSGFGAGLSMTVWSALVVPLPLFALSLAVDGPAAVGHALTHLTAANVLSTLYTAWLASLVGYGIWNTLLAWHQASAVVPFTMLVPVVGLTTAWLVLGEVPNGWEATGGVLLLAGVAITTGQVRMPRKRNSSGIPGGAVAGLSQPDPVATRPE